MSEILQWEQLEKRNAAARQASVDPHLEPGEEVLAIVPLRRKSGLVSLLKFPCLAVTPETVELPKLCTVAVTSRRFFLSSLHTHGEKTSELLVSRPLEEVRDVQVVPGRSPRSITEVTWTADGMQYFVWASGIATEPLERALRAGPATA